MACMIDAAEDVIDTRQSEEDLWNITLGMRYPKIWHAGVRGSLSYVYSSNSSYINKSDIFQTNTRLRIGLHDPS